MEGDLIGEPSNQENAGGTTLTDMFYRICPQYMVMGMTYDQFWHSNTQTHKAYRKAWEIKQRNDEFDRWRRGMYFYDALLKVSPVLRAFGKGKVEPGKYPEEPYPLTEKEAQEREQRDARRRYYLMRDRLIREAEQAHEPKNE